MPMGTESLDQRYKALDTRSGREVVSLILDAQQRGVEAVRRSAGAIAEAAEAMAVRLSGSGDGRIVYAGAGTSIRLGVQDGVELTPTFGWPSERLDFVIAGGDAALTRAIEGAEDDGDAARACIEAIGVGAADVCIALSASGRTPYTCAAARAAHQRGALTIAIANNAGAVLLDAADHPILIDSGAEPVAGSTRMTAGTTQKIVLNLLSTVAMVRLGRVYDGMMVDLVATNDKLAERARDMVRAIANVDAAAARRALDAANGHVKLAALLARGLTTADGQALLDRHAGDLRAALAELGG
ncbi:MAG: N-acetylmuramic acid 6-phosphate etherase [Alphaproteobacteria bacterium]|jgi:N-acetylmuramic acid 6-phosphate etherase